MSETKIALVTGASAGLGRALTEALVGDGWNVIATARGSDRLDRLRQDLGPAVQPVLGDVSDPEHRTRIADVLRTRARLDLVVNNASELGPSPMPRLQRYPLDELARVFATNVVAPLAILQTALPYLRASDGVAINISSDAAVGAYEGWGGYGSSKAALDHLTAILAAENSDLRIYAFDPGDMRTQMHQAAFPGEDISDRPEPATVVPALLRIIAERPSSGRYTTAEWLAGAAR
ncbi:SDR family NAD(P)-dependent oxidoreductase [Antrihabitans sp. NCIMB 15449]|jgi:NAD(P)-dependent dehydrogenase (short-subunit alcohol dehydrogenase family)|uniref:SDR family oxidoreductase n=2 Tax=Antrihabitans TaxID=2799491 RepID=A0A934U1B5_9NOCA|nr:SDR family oxidoreductase [Antrihabitans stalagmiti]MBJ8338175.1 SDR family oxidoreductase [Antrihabitans stalagmiti]